MSESYFPVESGALGPEENFLSLDDIVMSQEKLPVRVETPMPRLGAFFLERGAGAEADHPLPQVRRARGEAPKFWSLRESEGDLGRPRGSREDAQHAEWSPVTDFILKLSKVIGFANAEGLAPADPLRVLVLIMLSIKLICGF